MTTNLRFCRQTLGGAFFRRFLKEIRFHSRSFLLILVSLSISFSAAAQNSADNSDFSELNRVIQLEATDKNLPLLSIILVDENGVVWSGKAGSPGKGLKDVSGADITYKIGSVSKLFTDIAVMQFVEQGILDIDAPVTHYLPKFKPDNLYGVDITLRMLMSHSSGLVREPPVGNYFDPSEPSLEDTIDSLNKTTLVYEPGTKVQYSNAGIAVVGYVIQTIGGKPFASILNDKLLTKLGMSSSAFTPEENVLTNLPAAYMSTYQGTRPVAPTFELGIAPAGSMYSTMNDLARFMDALIKKGEGENGRILKASTLDQMWTPQTDILSGRDRSFGIGFSLSELDGEKSVEHGGAIYGFATQMKVLPGKKIGVAISTNLDMANGAVSRIADYALRILLATQNKENPPTFNSTTALPDNQAQRLIGTYKNDQSAIQIQRRFDDLYIERLGGLSLRLRASKADGSSIVIDGLPLYSEDLSFNGDSVTVFGDTYTKVENVMPDASEDRWAGLLGEYGFDHNILYIDERFGDLNALIEWGMEYPLEEISDGLFKFPPYGLYPNEHLTFLKSADGKVSGVSLNGIEFKRRSIGDVAGNVFKIKPVKPVPELTVAALLATPPHEDIPASNSDLVDITDYSETIKLDIRYASKDNFLDTPVYSSAKAFMQRPAAEALERIATQLKQKGYGLLVHDAYRPWYVTKIFWDATPAEGKDFVANPAEGSRHNRGAAVDLTLYDLKTGEPIEMVGVYDEMTERSYPHYPGGTTLQRWHRDLLRAAMQAEGFKVYPLEWWHFDFDGWEQFPLGNEVFENISANK